MTTKNVLIIDDDEIIREMANMILTKPISEEVLATYAYGCKDLSIKVLSAEDGMEAISVLHENLVDVILLDVEMPYMDGFQILDLLKSHESFQNIPVIMLTAATNKSSVIKAAKEGIVDYVAKPFLPDDLIKRTVKALFL